MNPTFSNPSEEFKRKNPHLFAAEGGTLPPQNTCLDSKFEIKLERELQDQIANLLSLKGIVAIRSRMDRKTSNQVGTPDFLFSVEHGLRSVPCAWECKLPGKKLSPEQQKMAVEMLAPPNAWVYKVITSVDEALMELKRLGLT